ncbi:MAG: Lrp/AsnC family transcriptional regulator [Pseudomonadota bacterium]
MDDLDKEMLRLLGANARLPVAVLAKKLGVARSTVQARLDRLELSGVIAGYTVRLGAAGHARRVQATALIQIEPRSTAQVLARLQSMPEITQATTTTGRFDFILAISTGSTEELDRVLDAIGMVPGIRSSESLVHLSKKIDRAV